ncbi:DTW domain-containing protein 1 [Cimex lectularius]|uniref:tRNA-uridine aminocarboxypropyltransferase 1 n=1 Tax=Cimex lectularius TaxID=79782 RepID=A0A8I6RM79_CIMLE|nr:DTW domain-containing protein 1 [Cimex lectularius]
MATPSVDDTRPFEGLKISENWRKLQTLDDRSVCERCNKSRKYFCYTCYLPVAEIKNDVPKIKLPLKVDVIKHCKEIDGKSTAIHAAVICPEDVTIYTYPAIPNYDPEKTLLVFPGKEAKSLDHWMSRTEVTFEKVIFIDSTWNQCKGIYKDARIKRLPCVVLRNRITQFWRHQNGSPRWYLSTIEAIHQFFFEYWLLVNKNEQLKSTYNGEYDNLLFFFRFMYDMIHTLYNHETLKSYKRPLE